MRTIAIAVAPISVTHRAAPIAAIAGCAAGSAAACFADVWHQFVQSRGILYYEACKARMTI